MTFPGEDELDRAYQQIAAGQTAYGPDIHLPDPNTEAALLAEWTTEVAEPWWQAMRERAARENRELECYVGGDPMLSSMGIEFAFPAAREKPSFRRLVRAERSARSQAERGTADRTNSAAVTCENWTRSHLTRALLIASHLAGKRSALSPTVARPRVWVIGFTRAAHRL
jgi:hypothetical protein